MLEFGKKEIKTFVEDYYNRNSIGKNYIFDTCEIIYSFRNLSDEVITTKASLFCLVSTNEYKKFLKSKNDFIVKGIVENGEMARKIDYMFYNLGLTSVYVLNKETIENIVIDYGYNDPVIKYYKENGEFNFKVIVNSDILENAKLIKQN